MIPVKSREGAVTEGLTGERRAFTIAANGKAFRTLIDGLYSNKVRAVTRELWSNALDSHIEAGKASVPFHASVPTALDPTFRVRDFGVGLSHNQVMHLYTTIFQSTKEQTNEQTGQLGLGSKSPFAYTDSFSVVTYDGAEKRVYIAHIAVDGVPQITHLETMASSEPRGVEISFAVQREDMATFAREAQFVSIGFKVPPVMVGMDLRLLKPRLAGDGWAIYPQSSLSEFSNARSFIRQGCVAYPSHSMTVDGLGYSWATIIDIPIGTADVTASREALSYDSDTTAAVQAIVDRVSLDITKHVEAEVAKATTRREVAMAWHEFNGVFSNRKGSANVSLLSDPNNYSIRRDGDVLLLASEVGSNRRYTAKASQSIEVHTIDDMKIYVDDGTKMVRRNSRIKAVARKHHDYILEACSDTAGAVAWVTKCLGLLPSQIVPLSSIPDIPPTARKGASAPKKVLEAGQFWMIRHGNFTESIWGEAGRKEMPRQFDYAINSLPPNNELRQARNNVLFVTTKQAASLGLPDSRRYDLVIQAELVKRLAEHDLEQAIKVHTISSLGYGVKAEVLREAFFKNLTMNSRQAQEIIDLAAKVKIDWTNTPEYASIKLEISNLSKKYPLLFGNAEDKVYHTYIEQVNLASTKTVQEVSQ